MKCDNCGKETNQLDKSSCVSLCMDCQSGKNRKTTQERITELETALSEALGSFGSEADKIVFSEKVEMWREVLDAKI